MSRHASPSAILRTPSPPVRERAGVRSATQVVVRPLRERVTIASGENFPQGIESIWRSRLQTPQDLRGFMWPFALGRNSGASERQRGSGVLEGDWLGVRPTAFDRVIALIPFGWSDGVPSPELKSFRVVDETAGGEVAPILRKSFFEHFLAVLSKLP